MSRKYYSVITTDVVGSRQVAFFPKKRDRRLLELSGLHKSKGFILSPYAVTAWDEFEVVMAKPEFAPAVILDLRRLFYPMELRIAVGIGPATGVYKVPVNVHGEGIAFERARESAEFLKRGNPRYRALTAFSSGNEVFDTIANTVYRLQDSLLQRTTARQWEVVNALFETGRLDQTARRLRRDISTVSRNLKRGSYWQLIETADSMRQIIAAYF